VSAISTHKEPNRAGGFAHSKEPQLDSPLEASGWNISVDAAWTSQDSVTLQKVTKQ
jgi:hypothetical protein